MSERRPLPGWTKPLFLLLGVVAIVVGARLLTGGHLKIAAAYQGPNGVAKFFLLAAAACAFGLPRQLVASVASASYGLWPGIAIAGGAQAAGCALDFFWARFVAHEWAQRRMGPRLTTANAFLTAHPFSATLMLRMFPVGNNLALNLLAGVSTVPAVPFIAASLIGYFPQTLVFALVGTGHSVQLTLGIALFAMSTILGLWLAKRHRELPGSE